MNQSSRSAYGRTLKLGFVPLVDCAPLVMAQELGLFCKYGLGVNLSRELGWASIRDKIVYGELDAAHALAAMPFAATLGLGSNPCECLSALVLNLHGNAITLAHDLWLRGVRDGASLREEIARLRHDKTLTFGVVFPFSSHNFLLRGWLASAGISAERDVRIVIVPPPQMVTNLKAGHLDGFCVGEPWNSVAVQAEAGWCIATSAELAPQHPEKILMVTREFAEKHAEQHVALVAALLDACEYCAAPENREQIVTTLARPEYVNARREALLHSFSGEFDFGHDLRRTVPEFCVFSGEGVNEPTAQKAGWVLQHLRESGLCKTSSALSFAFGRQVFRADIFEKAMRLRASTPTVTQQNESKTEISLTRV